MTNLVTKDLAELHQRLEEAEETLRAIRSGEVDALVVSGPDGEQIYTLHGADHPYRTLTEAMQQGAMSLSPDGTILYCNLCFAQMLATPHEKVVGSSIMAWISPGYKTTFDQLFRQGRKTKSQGEFELTTSEGTILPAFVALSPLPLSESQSICMVVTDLTEQKKHQDLQEINRRKDEFLAMLAHELRNPLAPIQNAVVILQHLGLTNEKLTYAREIIDRQVHHLSHLVDDLLDVSRITLGKVKLEKQPLEMATIISRAVETSRPAIDARRHQLTLSVPPKAIRVEGDPTRLAQVLANLLTNAAKYTEENGEIFLSCERANSEVVIRVRDTGIGISTDLLPRVFDLFTQGDRSLARSEGGLGIGLTLVRRLVEMHGGTVDADSPGLGKGSEFVVRLPALSNSSNPAASNHGINHDHTTCPSRSVLIVEDNRDGADTLAMLLKMMNHDVHVAYNGTDAIKALQKLLPDIVLLDIGLPVMNGYEVAAKIRQIPGFSKTVLVAMTGYGQDEDRQKSLVAGFNHHLVKPVEPAVLRQMFETL